MAIIHHLRVRASKPSDASAGRLGISARHGIGRVGLAGHVGLAGRVGIDLVKKNTNCPRRQLTLPRGCDKLPALPSGTVGEALLARKPPSNDRPPMAAAMEWVSKITTVSLEMVLPGIAGSWADRYFQTEWLAPMGFFLGFAIGFYHLLRMTRSGSSGESGDSSRKRDDGE